MAEENKKDIAIEVIDVDKSFDIPNEKLDNIKSAFTNPLKFFRRDTHKFEALKDITFTLNKGEFLGIVGRNGSGKSTLLKLISGIYSPDKGKVIVHGHMIPFLELGVGFNPELSGRENIFLNGTILGMTKRFIESKYNDIVDFAELGEFIDTPVKNFSSGMMLRLAFSIAIQSDADVYILDEILAVGDAVFQQKCFIVIRELIAKGKTIILVSHSLQMIEQYCTHVVWIDKGRVRFFGDKDEGLRLYEESIEENQVALVRSNKLVDSVGTKEITIKNIELVHDKDDSSILIDLNHKDDVKSLNITLGLYRETGENISTLSTEYDNLNIDPSTKRIELEFDKSNLVQGRYFFNIAIYGESEESPYLWKRRVVEFEIKTDGTLKRSRGIINIKHKWKIYEE